MINFPDSLQLAQRPTPIEPLNRLSLKCARDCRLWIKRDDATGCSVSGNKVRKLEFTLADARQQGADVLVTCGGVQSNHCRATALLGARLGFDVHLLLRGKESELNYRGNHLLDVLAGAAISCISPSDYHNNFDNIVEQTLEFYRQQGRKPYWITTGASDAVGVWGYIRACEELSRQFGHLPEPPAHIVCAAGSGGTLAGLVAGAKLYELPSTVWAVNVCDDEAYFKCKSRQDLRDWKNRYRVDLDVENLPLNILDGYVGPGYGRADPEIYDLIRQVAQQEGILLDPVYTGKAFYGMLEEMKKGRFGGGDILFLHTGGLFGLLAADPAELLA